MLRKLISEEESGADNVEKLWKNLQMTVTDGKPR